jgi:hypothetical protein
MASTAGEGRDTGNPRERNEELSEESVDSEWVCLFAWFVLFAKGQCEKSLQRKSLRSKNLQNRRIGAQEETS